MTLQRTLATTLICTAALAATGCAVTRGQESVGAYVDDSAITTAVKARFVENQLVDAAAISVETLNGTVMLSGFAKSPRRGDLTLAANKPTHSLWDAGAMNVGEQHDGSRRGS